MSEDELHDYLRYRYQRIIHGLTWEQIDNIPRYELELTIVLYDLEQQKLREESENQFSQLNKPNE